MRRYIISTSTVLGLLLGCNTLDEKGSDTGATLFIPVDERPVQQALTAPPPISGGTLAVSPDGRYAVAADPDRDRVSIVTLASHEVRNVALEPGDEPGRVAIDARGRAHVALRRGGSVASIDLASAALESRTAVCPSPRGLVHDGARNLLHVACADGRLVSLDAALATTRSVDLKTDLRDVMVRGNELIVSTFKGAELLTVDAEGSVRERVQPPKSDVIVQRNPKLPETELQPMQSHLAWRSLQSADGSIVMLHQQASAAEVDIDSKPEPEAVSSYGGGGGPGRTPCAGIVHTTMTDFGTGGDARSMALDGAVLAVDMARSPRTGVLAFALAGTSEPDAPRPQVVSEGEFDDSPRALLTPGGGPGDFFGNGGVAIIDGNGSPMGRVLAPGDENGLLTCGSPRTVQVEGQPTAVAFTQNGDLLVQSREPAVLMVMTTGPDGIPTPIALGGESVRDTGHDVFHRNAGAGIACASCHGEGGDDGHTWVFSGIGARRTQAVNIGLAGTAPFHWDGELHDLGVLMEEVFVGRMGGVHQNKPRMGALTDWLFAQEPPSPIVAAGDPAAERGKALFESGSVGCTGCHAGERMTDNRSYDVGTGIQGGRLMQVPSLRGVGYRAPFIHDGCAATLRDRFDPNCGGDKHGNTAQLDGAQIDDLIAYLQSL